MPTVKELREKRAGIWAQVQEFNERHRKGEQMSAEDNAAWDRGLKEVDELKVEIDRLERTEALDKEFDEIDERTGRNSDGPAPEGRASDGTGGDGANLDAEYRKAFTDYLRGGLEEMAPEQRKLMRDHFTTTRAQGVGTGAAGGYTVPEGFWNKVTETMKYFGGVLQSGVEVLDTSSGEDIPWPTNDDTGNEGIELAENTAVTDQDLAFGGKTLGAIMYTSRQVKASLQFLQDTAIDAESFVARKLGERLGRIYNRRWTTGTGAGQPQGWVTGATTGKTTGSATAITYDDLIDLMHSVDIAYREGPNVGWQLHDLVLAYVRKIRDDSGGAGLGRPIWEPSVQVGQPDLLLGKPYAVNNHMASTITTGQKTIGFGNWQAMYVARRVRDAQVLRLAERYAEFLQVGFFAFQRMDGLVQDPSAAKVLVQA